MFNNRCPNCQKPFGKTSTNWLILQLIGKAASNSSFQSRNPFGNELNERSSAEIQLEIEERERVLHLRKLQEIQTQISDIETKITLISEEKDEIDHNIVEFKNTLRALECESLDKRKEIDSLKHEKTKLQQSIISANTGRHIIPAHGGAVGATGLMLDSRTLTKTCAVCGVRAGSKSDVLNHIRKKHPEYRLIWN